MPTPEPGPSTSSERVSAAQIEIRAVQNASELRRAFAAIAPLFEASVEPDQDFRLDRLLEHVATDRAFMLLAVDAHRQIRGAALGYRTSMTAVKIQALAVEPQLRRCGVATRLVGELEQRALLAGSTSIHLGAEESARPFYASMGYQGRRSVLSKSLTGAALATSSQARQERLTALRAARARRQTDRRE